MIGRIPGDSDDDYISKIRLIEVDLDNHYNIVRTFEMNYVKLIQAIKANKINVEHITIKTCDETYFKLNQDNDDDKIIIDGMESYERETLCWMNSEYIWRIYDGRNSSVLLDIEFKRHGVYKLIYYNFKSKQVSTLTTPTIVPGRDWTDKYPQYRFVNVEWVTVHGNYSTYTAKSSDDIELTRLAAYTPEFLTCPIVATKTGYIMGLVKASYDQPASEMCNVPFEEQNPCVKYDRTVKYKPRFYNRWNETFIEKLKFLIEMNAELDNVDSYILDNKNVDPSQRVLEFLMKNCDDRVKTAPINPGIDENTGPCMYPTKLGFLMPLDINNRIIYTQHIADVEKFDNMFNTLNKLLHIYGLESELTEENLLNISKLVTSPEVYECGNRRVHLDYVNFGKVSGACIILEESGRYVYGAVVKDIIRHRIKYYLSTRPNMSGFGPRLDLVKYLSEGDVFGRKLVLSGYVIDSTYVPLNRTTLSGYMSLGVIRVGEKECIRYYLDNDFKTILMFKLYTEFDFRKASLSNIINNGELRYIGSIHINDINEDELRHAIKSDFSQVDKRLLH